MLTVVQGGRTRRAAEVVCEQCGEKFLRRDDEYGRRRPQRFCSIECRSLATRNREEYTCAACGKEFDRTASKLKCSRSGIVFCSRGCKDKASRLAGGISEIWPGHYGNNGSGVKLNIRSDMIEAMEKGCVNCGERRRYLITVHHIDSDRSNNNLDNVEVVCWNHHAMRHLQFIDGEWGFNFKALTPREMLPELCKASVT